MLFRVLLPPIWHHGNENVRFSPIIPQRQRAALFRVCQPSRRICLFRCLRLALGRKLAPAYVRIKSIHLQVHWQAPSNSTKRGRGLHGILQQVLRSPCPVRRLFARWPDGFSVYRIGRWQNPPYPSRGVKILAPNHAAGKLPQGRQQRREPATQSKDLKWPD